MPGIGLLAVVELTAAADWPHTLVGPPRDGPIGVALGDLDGDGDLDVVDTRSLADEVRAYENLGGRAFGPPVVVQGGATGAGGVALGDVDGDGDPDVVYAATSADRVSVAFNDGAFTFRLGPELVAVAQPYAVVLADLDGDGDLDVAYDQPWDDRIGWWENLGGGAMGGDHLVDAAARFAWTLRAVDLDADGRMDLLSAQTATLVAYGNVGGGAFARTDLAAGTQGHDLDAADLDGDGDLDVAGAFFDPGSVVTVEQVSPGVFAPAVTLASFPDAGAIDAADLDLDGDQDLVVATPLAGGPMVWLPSSGAGFGVERPIASRSSRGLAIGDLDADGAPDLVFAAYPDNLTEVRWNVAADPDRDHDGDGWSVSAGDCRDADPAVHPGAVESPCTGVDDDCDAATPDDPDSDLDGSGACEDCDDADPARAPGFVEVPCDGHEEDCDPATSDQPDADGDGVGLCDADCDDADRAVYPGNVEQTCTARDEDCDPSTEDRPDGDRDGADACEDCDDADPLRAPGRLEVACNGIDDDCDGATPDDGGCATSTGDTGSTAGTTDTASTTDPGTTDPSTTDEGAPESAAERSGCGCAATGGRSVGLLAGAAALAGRRRRGGEVLRPRPAR